MISSKSRNKNTDFVGIATGFARGILRFGHEALLSSAIGSVIPCHHETPTGFRSDFIET